MNKGQLTGESGYRFPWAVACVAFLVFVGLVAVKPGDLRRRAAAVRRRAAAVQIDKNGTARLGGRASASEPEGA